MEIIDSTIDKRHILQLILLIGCILSMIFNSINFMDNYSEESRSNFKSERNLKLFGCIILMLFIYLSGGFNLIF